MSHAVSPPQENDALFAQVYDRLKAMARRRLAGHARGTLDTTAIVHELYLRIRSGQEPSFAHPDQFFTYAAIAMRHLLVDRARGHLSRRAGGDWERTTLTGDDHRLVIESAEQVMAVEDALCRLEAADARAARVVELAIFAGLDQERIGAVLGVARITIARDWRFAKAFLREALG